MIGEFACVSEGSRQHAHFFLSRTQDLVSSFYHLVFVLSDIGNKLKCRIESSIGGHFSFLT